MSGGQSCVVISVAVAVVSVAVVAVLLLPLRSVKHLKSKPKPPSSSIHSAKRLRKRARLLQLRTRAQGKYVYLMDTKNSWDTCAQQQYKQKPAWLPLRLPLCTLPLSTSSSRIANTLSGAENAKRNRNRNWKRKPAKRERERQQSRSEREREKREKEWDREQEVAGLAVSCGPRLIWVSVRDSWVFSCEFHTKRNGRWQSARSISNRFYLISAPWSLDRP